MKIFDFFSQHFPYSRWTSNKQFWRRFPSLLALLPKTLNKLPDMMVVIFTKFDFLISSIVLLFLTLVCAATRWKCFGFDFNEFYFEIWLFDFFYCSIVLLFLILVPNATKNHFFGFDSNEFDLEFWFFDFIYCSIVSYLSREATCWVRNVLVLILMNLCN